MGLIAAIFAGFIASLVGAAIWAGITVATSFQIGFMALGVGFLVGIAVRAAGNSSSTVYGVIGAAFALFGCVMGNLLSGVGFAAKEASLGYFEALLQVNPDAVGAILQATFSPMDIVFYILAIVEGYKFSIAGKH